jgi:uncharacterized protein YfaA (DUF2138 family)
MSFPQKLLAIVALTLVLTLSAAASVAVYLLQPPPVIDNTDNVALQIQTVDVVDRPPDALIRTYSLSRLPVDLLRLPVAKDVLTEDFVDYYENHENRLSLLGAARRIAYEHKLDWTDRLVASVFDEPAEVALWRDDGGRLQYFAVAMTRNVLAQAIQAVLPTLPDAQLRSAGKLQGTEAEILLLEYGARARLLLIAQGDRVVALSDPGMLLSTTTDENGVPGQRGEAVAWIAPLLGEAAGVSAQARHFGLAALPANAHELVFSSPVFAFGYSTFAPDLQALKLQFDAEGAWQGAARTAQTAAWAESLWSSLPHGPGLCAALPVDWTALAQPLENLNNRLEVVSEDFAQRFEGAAAVCWHQDSRLYTPLFAARLKTAPDATAAKEFFALAAAATRAQTGVGAEANFDEKTGVGLWQGEVASRFGQGEGRDVEARKLRPALALQGNLVFFSPDVALVKRALDVAAKRYPALADSFEAPSPDNAVSAAAAPPASEGPPTATAPLPQTPPPQTPIIDTLAFIDPAALAGLLRQEIFAALPPDEEALFRNAAEVYLAPRLDALARYPAQRIRLEAAPSGSEEAVWRPLVWEAARVAGSAPEAQ